MGLISSQGEITRVEQSPYPLVYNWGGNQYTWGSIELYSGRFRDYASIWRTQPNVRTVVSFLGRNVAQLALKVYRRLSDTEREQVAGHPLAQTLQHPNDYTTQYRLFDALVQSIALYDNALWAKFRGDLGEVALAHIPWPRVQALGANFLVADKFRIRGNQGGVELDRSEVVHFHGFNPDDPRQGVSPMETLRRILAEEAAAGDYRESFWHNAARSDVVLSRPADSPKWTPEAKERFKKSFAAFYKGTENAGETPILEDGMTVAPWPSFSAEDSQYIEARKLTREEVAAAFHIPPPMVGILDHATFSNIDTQHRMLYQDTLGPWLTMIEQEIELQLLPEFDDSADVYVEFNLAEKLKGSFEEQAQQLQSAVGAPWMLRDEARARVNLPALPNGEGLRPVVPLNVLEGGLASPNDTAPPPKSYVMIDGKPCLIFDLAPAAVDNEVARIEERTKLASETSARFASFFDKCARSICSAVGALKPQKASEVFERRRWSLLLQELLDELGAGEAEPVIDAIAAGLDDALKAADPLAATRALFEEAKTTWAEALARAVS